MNSVGGRALDELGRALEELGRALDELGRALEELGRALFGGLWSHVQYWQTK